ncbi:MAG: histidine--tRNA ligase [Planctomycetota bacterium]|jgi:histidyl-tRNA synthetase
MKIPPVKGTRDFYPPDMAIRNWIIDGWKKVSVRNGFEEYDGPIFEYLKMFQIKSGDEIVEQLFSLKDRGGRDLALRPEITPTLARMVNQQINSLPKPIKWFSVPRLFRAERPQRGRLREFFQWNIDIIGVDDVLADAEVIFTTVDYLSTEAKLTPRDIRVKISSRKLLASSLMNIGIRDSQLDSLYVLLDKYAKIPGDTFGKMLAEQVPDSGMAKRILDLMDAPTLYDVPQIVGTNAQVEDAIQELARLRDLLQQMGVWKYCDFYPSIVRGLAYYTGVVFEVHEFAGELRAICGGGRFDNLLHDFGGPSVPATGMGMGDCVLEILLREKGLLEKELPEKQLDFFVACVDRQFFQNVLEIATAVRRRKASANFGYKSGSLSKQLKEASAQNAVKCIIVGEEFKQNKLVVKDMATGDQHPVDYDKFLADLEVEPK